MPTTSTQPMWPQVVALDSKKKSQYRGIPHPINSVIYQALANGCTSWYLMEATNLIAIFPFLGWSSGDGYTSGKPECKKI